MPHAESAMPEAAERVLASLNPEQRAAAAHGEAPLLIVAGAGTGKTATLAHRTAYLIANGVPAGRVLLLTFTRRAAAEMLRRVETLLRDVAPELAAGGQRVWGGTFHAVGTRLLRIHAESLGLHPAFTVLDRGDAEDLMHHVRTELALGASSRRFPQKATCLDIYSRCVNAREPLADVLRTRYPWCAEHAEDLGRLFDAYTERKEHAHVLDYDDVLLFWRGMLADPALGPVVRERFDHVLVDEYQDTNALQAEIVALLRPDGTGVTAVGDDAQSIYSFRAATVRNILEFPERFPGASVITLERNYRSTQPILDATNAIIASSPERFDKALWTTREGGARPALVTCTDETEQSDYLIERILGHREEGIALKRQAVLFRAAHHSMALEVELKRRNIPFVKYGGLKFTETAHVKDVLAILRLAENPLDPVAGLRALQLLPGIGPRMAAALLAELADRGGDFEAWLAWRPPEATSALWREFVSLMRALAAAPATDVAGQFGAARAFLTPLLEARYDSADARVRDLEQLEVLAAGFADRSRFLADVALDPPSWAGEYAGVPLLDEDYLILSTMHSAKGLEFDCVYVIHAADGNIPSDMATGSPEEIEEERRLLYVACTRARDALYVTHPLRYYAAGRGSSDRYGYAQRTRFISSAMASLFADGPARPDSPPDDTHAAGDPVATSASIRAELTGLWGR